MVTKQLCARCGKKMQLISLPHIKNVCQSCFARMIEKRVRKYVRKNKIFRKNDRLLVIDDLSFFLVKSIIKGMPSRIFMKKMSIDGLAKKDAKEYIKKNKISRIVAPWTLDDEANLFLDNLFSKKNKKLDEDYIKLLISITDNEAALFAKIRKLEFAENKKNEDIKNMLDLLEQRYPETKFSLLRSIEQMRRILKRK